MTTVMHTVTSNNVNWKWDGKSCCPSSTAYINRHFYSPPWRTRGQVDNGWKREGNPRIKVMEAAFSCRTLRLHIWGSSRTDFYLSTTSLTLSSETIEQEAVICMVGETKWFYTHPHHANPSRNLLPTTRPFLQKALCLDTIALLRAVVLVDVVVEVKTTNVSKTRKQVQNANNSGTTNIHQQLNPLN